MLKTLLLFFPLLLLTSAVFGQFKESDFALYTVADGLSDNNVTCIAQDKLGYTWIGTEMGLNSFDGESFEHYSSRSKPLDIVGSYIVNLVPFGDNRFGVITREGLQVINTERKSTQNYRFNDGTPFSHYLNGVYDATLLPDGSVLFSSNTGIYQCDRPGHLCFRYDSYTSDDPESKRILYAKDIIIINSNEALIYTAGYKLDHYDFRKKTLYHVPLASKEWKDFSPDQQHGTNYKKIAENQFILYNPYADSLVFYDRARKMRVVSRPSCLKSKELNWASRVFMLNDSTFVMNSSKAGFYLFDLNKKTGLISGNPQKFFSAYKCNYFFVDKDDRLWIGTRTGLLRQRKNTAFIKSAALFSARDAGSSARFTSACRYKGKLYVGSFNRFAGLFIVDTATLQVRKKMTFYGGDNEWSEIQSIQSYHRDTLWLGTSNGILWLDVNNYHYGHLLDNQKDSVLAGGNVMLAPVDKKGRGWMFDYMNGKAGFYDTTKRTFAFFTTASKPALPFARIKHLVYDSYGDVWIAGHGMSRWNDAKQQFDSFMNVYAGPNKSRDDILAITADNRGSLWLYNAENVLLEYKIKEKKFYEHGAAEGLPVFVQSMASAANDRLWFTTGSQLICYTPSTKKVVSFDQHDGLPMERSSARIIFYDKGRDCYYSLHDDYLACFPAKVPALQETTKNLRLTKIVFPDSVIYNPTGKLRVGYSQQNFSIHFAPLNYEEPHSCNFYYNLDDKAWINLDGLEVIAFNHLAPGRHRIQIKAVTKLGRQLVTGIILTIIPPFWQRWWFIALLFFVLIAILYSIYSYRINQIIKLQAVRNNIARDLHDDIASTMGSINIYSEIAADKIKKQQPIVAEEILQKIGLASRQMIEQMSDIVWSINSANDYLENLTDRMKAFCSLTLLPAGINFHFEVSTAFLGARLPMEKRKNIFLTFKECIHNILKYADCKNVTITINMQQNKIKMTITDDGKGFDLKNGAAYNGNGLPNMRQRAAAMRGKFSIRTGIGEGTAVELQLDV
jgi:ligand-binding sensor domain-containing protein